jgi:hypothetical protein
MMNDQVESLIPGQTPGQSPEDVPGNEEGSESNQDLDLLMDNASGAYDAAADMISNADDPVKYAGIQAGMLFRTMIMSANKAGKPISKDLSTGTLKGIVEDFVEMGVKMGSIPAENQEQVTKASNRAFKFAMKTYAEAEKSTQDQQKQQGPPQQQGQPQQGPPQQAPVATGPGQQMPAQAGPMGRVLQ